MTTGYISMPSPVVICWGRAAGYVDLPEMAAIDVALIRSDDRERFVARDRDVFNFKFSGCQRGNRAAFGRDRIDVRPAVSLGHEQQPIARDPLPDIVAAKASKERIVVGIARVPDFLSIASVRVDDPDGPRLYALTIRGEGIGN